MVQRFPQPQLAGIRISHSWGGRVAVPFDYMPHIGQQDGIHYALGCNGSGVVMMNWLGHRIAQKDFERHVGPGERLRYRHDADASVVPRQAMVPAGRRHLLPGARLARPSPRCMKGRVRAASTTSRAIGRRSLILASAASVAAPAIVRAEAPWPSQAHPHHRALRSGRLDRHLDAHPWPPSSARCSVRPVLSNIGAGAGGVVVRTSSPSGARWIHFGHCTVSQVVIAPPY